MRQGEAFITTRSEGETEHVGALIGQNVVTPLAVALQGELGAGKTVLVRGAARALGVKGPVSSPTFILMQVYQGWLPVYHFDFYRLQEPEELEALDLDEYLPGDGVAFVEWAERFPGVLPADRLQVIMERFYDDRGEGRRILLVPHGTTCASLVEKVMEGITWRVNGTLHRVPPSPDAGAVKGYRRC